MGVERAQGLLVFAAVLQRARVDEGGLGEGQVGLEHAGEHLLDRGVIGSHGEDHALDGGGLERLAELGELGGLLEGGVSFSCGDVGARAFVEQVAVLWTIAEHSLDVLTRGAIPSDVVEEGHVHQGQLQGVRALDGLVEQAVGGGEAPSVRGEDGASPTSFAWCASLVVSMEGNASASSAARAAHPPRSLP